MLVEAAQYSRGRWRLLTRNVKCQGLCWQPQNTAHWPRAGLRGQRDAAGVGCQAAAALLVGVWQELQSSEWLALVNHTVGPHNG